jgi:hypothetical protein
LVRNTILLSCPRALEIARVKGSNKLCVDKYFDELSAVIHKYNLEDKPHLIYNVDEKDIQANHKPPNVVDRSETVTLLGCGNAAGNAIPLFEPLTLGLRTLRSGHLFKKE